MSSSPCRHRSRAPEAPGATWEHLGGPPPSPSSIPGASPS
uniref:Uncharacterized protein n=1 Tax=Triticum urartu TaxID=4572 RepID=A0A8R7UV61_TRIUA